MSYVGNTPFTAAFLTDTFSGNGSTVAFTMSVAPATTSSVIVAITGVLQDPSTYSVSGTTLTFSAAPPTGTSNISVRYLGIPASGVTTTAYRTQTEFTATAGQTTFSVPSYTVGFIDVYRNGLLLGSPDFTATNGTTVVLTNAASAGDFVETVSFYVSSVLNALPTTGGTLSGNLVVNGELTTSGNTVLGDASTDTLNVGNGGLVKDASGNVGIGTTTPGVDVLNGAPLLRLQGAGAGLVINDTTSGGKYALLARTGASTNLFRIYDVSAGADRLTIDSSGNVAMGGTVSTGILNPSRITISGNNGVPAGSGNGQGNVGTYTAYGLTLLGQGSSYDISFLNKTGSFAGYVATGATTITTSSDERLKENNQPITGALDAVCQMRHETGNYKSDPDRTVAFLIAQDVDKLFPYAVEKADPESWGVNYNWIIPLHGAAITELTALVKEQQAIITQLQADVAALKGNS